jgi:hypothetical protein
VAGFLFVFALFVPLFVKVSRRIGHGLQVRRALHAGVPEIIARRTCNPRCFRFEMVRSLLCNFVALTCLLKFASEAKHDAD